MLPLSPQREEYLRKKRNRRLSRYGILLFSLLLFIGLLSYGAHRPEIRISKITLTGGVLVTEEEVSSKSLEYMKGSYFFLFPKNNALWYSKKSLKNYLKEAFKRIDTIDIQLEGLKTLVITITERKHFALWCEEERPSESDGSAEATTPKCYFMDKNSTIFAEAPTFSGDAYFKYYGLVDGSPIGKEYIASTTRFAEISGFVDSAKKLGVKPLYLLAKGNDDFSLVLSGGGEIYFDTKVPLQKTAQNLELLLQTPGLATSTSRNLPVDYIDLRFGNKLFYKLKQ